MPAAIGPLTAYVPHLDAEVGASPTSSQLQSHRTTQTGTNAAAFSQRLSTETTSQVGAKRTPLSAQAAGQAIADAYTALTGETLNDSARSILTAQWAHETGHGNSMFNFNFGGIKGVGPSGLTVAQRTREGYGHAERRIVDNFRAYSSAEEGARDYLQLLLSRYGSAMTAAQQGDAAGFVKGLKDRGYFTGDPVAYERSITNIANQLAATTGGPNFAAVSPAVGARAAADFEPTLAPRSRPAGAEPVRLRASLGVWQQAPTPRALLDLDGHPDSARSSIDNIADLSVERALTMSDEVTRAALRIAMDRDETERRYKE